ncbi:MAG: hypothetical protein WCV43_06305 [Candidatus Caldatribacteriota bacterium]
MKILIDNNQLEKYIKDLEKDINATGEVDSKVELLLTNILKQYSDFNDRRALSARNIEAVTELLKLKADLPMKRVQTKKHILDIMTKKDELEIKKKIVKANTDIAESTSELLKLIFNTLDQRQIHPVVIDVENDPEYLDIIDVPLIEEETKEEKENNVKEEENQVVDLNDEQQQILLLQSTLDNRNMEE